MSIPAIARQAKFGEYLLPVVRGDSEPYQDHVEIAKSLFDVLPATMTFGESREERMKEL